MVRLSPGNVDVCFDRDAYFQGSEILSNSLCIHLAGEATADLPSIIQTQQNSQVFIWIFFDLIFSNNARYIFIISLRVENGK